MGFGGAVGVEVVELSVAVTTGDTTLCWRAPAGNVTVTAPEEAAAEDSSLLTVVSTPTLEAG